MCVGPFKRDSTRDGKKEQVKPAEGLSGWSIETASRSTSDLNSIRYITVFCYFFKTTTMHLNLLTKYTAITNNVITIQ